MLVQVDIKVFFTFELVKEFTGMHGLEASFLALDLRVLLFHCFRNFNQKIRNFYYIMISPSQEVITYERYVLGQV